MYKLTYGIFGAALVLGLAAPAMAQGLPSAKAAVKYSDIINLGAACQADNNAGTPVSPSCKDDTGWQTILQTQMKVASQKDLVFDMALQCQLITDTTVRSKNGSTGTANAAGGIKVRIVVDPTPLNTSSGDEIFADPANDSILPANTSGIGADFPADGVTYCYRFQQLTAQFSGINCTAGADGKVTCSDPEMLRLLLETLEAHAFNFVAPDLAAGTYGLIVQARALAGALAISTDSEVLNEAAAEANVGLGSLLVEEVRLVKGSDLSM